MIEAFDDFYLSTRAQLLGELAALTAEPEVAKQSLQCAYAQAWQQWAHVSRLDDPLSWVRTVAWERAVAAYRRRKPMDWLLRTVRRGKAAVSSQAGATLEVHHGLRLLRDADRRTLVLHDLCDLTLERVAEETGVPVETAKRRLWRARADLESYLKRDLFSEDTITFGGRWT